MFETTIAGSLPKPSWLVEPRSLWAPWRDLDGPMTIVDTLAVEHCRDRPAVATRFAEVLNDAAKQLAAGATIVRAELGRD